MPLLGGERQEVTSPALERIPAQEKTGIWNLIKSISSLLSTRPPPLPSGDPLEQLVRHFLIETGPKGVKIKGCPSEPYFGEAQGPRGSQEGGGRAGEGGIPVGTSGLLSPPPAGSLSALVSQHSISPLSLPCCLRIPSKGGCL